MRQRLCEALYAAGRIKEAGESLLNIVNTVDEEVYVTEPIVTWAAGKLCFPVPLLCIERFATDFLQRCLSTPETSVDTAFHSPSPLLREWAKAKLKSGSWKDALVAALNVSVSFCPGSSRWLDILFVWRLQPQGSPFTVLSATISKRPIS